MPDRNSTTQRPMTMECRWHVRFEVVPHSTGRGEEVDQAAAGARLQCFYIDAKNAHDAIRLADCIGYGLLANPAVWCATIISVTRRL